MNFKAVGIANATLLPELLIRPEKRHILDAAEVDDIYRTCIQRQPTTDVNAEAAAYLQEVREAHKADRQ